jgi:hypothetical protein
MSTNDKQPKGDRVEEVIIVEEIIIEEVDIEECARAGKHPPKAKRYRIRVDDRYFVVTEPRMTGRAILLLAGKTPPESYILTQKIRGGGLHTVELGEVVDFTKPGIERFNTLPRQVQEG